MKLYTAQELADLMDCPITTIRRWHRDGLIKTTQFGEKGTIRISENEVKRIMGIEDVE